MLKCMGVFFGVLFGALFALVMIYSMFIIIYLFIQIILDQSWKAILIFLFFAKNSLFQNVAFPSLQVNKVSLLIQMIMIDTILMNCKCIICPEHLPLSSGSVLTILEATPLFSGSALESPCERAEAVQLLIPLCPAPQWFSRSISEKEHVVAFFPLY